MLPRKKEIKVRRPSGDKVIYLSGIRGNHVNNFQNTAICKSQEIDGKKVKQKRCSELRNVCLVGLPRHSKCCSQRINYTVFRASVSGCSLATSVCVFVTTLRLRRRVNKPLILQIATKMPTCGPRRLYIEFVSVCIVHINWQAISFLGS